MKKFKQIDFYVSVALLIAGLLYSVVTQNNTFIWAYLVVGAWQVISMVVHAKNSCFTQKGGGRYMYHSTTASIIGIALLGFVFYPLLFIFFILLFIAPFMAIGYTYLCYNETYIKMKRPLDDLK
jgi:cobalamin synthase